MKESVSVIEAKALDGYRLELTFSDGVRGVVDLANRIIGRGGVFQPLEDRQFFHQFHVDPELGTVVWPNEADFCPDMLHDWAGGTAVPLPETEAYATK
jgi:hypothetical protein